MNNLLSPLVNYLLTIGNKYADLGFYLPVIVTFQQILKIDSDCDQARFNLGRIYYELLLYPEESGEYKKVIS